MGRRSAELARRRRDRALAADRRLTELFAGAVPGQAPGLALVAVGGYGRSELSPRSDLDVVLVHTDAVGAEEIARIAEEIWYPLWNDGVTLDHAVREVGAMREAAASDHRVALGLLDARAVAGDASLVTALRETVLSDYRRDARTHIEQLRADREARLARSDWVAYAARPDLKSSGGGLRDTTVLRALDATGLIPPLVTEAEELRADLLDVRDVLHEVTGRGTERLDPEFVPDIAVSLGVSPEQLDLRVRTIGRRIGHLCALAWGRIDDVLQARAPEPISAADEVVVDADSDPASDPEVALRVAVVAARSGRPLAAGSVARLAATLGDLPTPWPPSSRDAMVELLSAGPGLVAVWHELDYAGIVDRWLPEWERIRLRGSSSPVHRFTIDRHSIETCVNMAAQQRGIDRPDLLAVASLLHDIGKGHPGDHSEVGEPMAVEIALRWGFGHDDAAMIGRLVRWHLLLPTVATRRDIEDPTTVANVAEIVEDLTFLDLLAALTASDAAATSTAAWSSWRRGLVEGLIRKTAEYLADPRVVETDEYEGWPAHVPLPDTSNWVESGFALTVEPHHGGSLLTVVSRDEPGIMTQLAGAFAVAGLDLRSARASTCDGAAVSLWEVTRSAVDAQRLRQRVRAVLAGEVDLETRLGRPAAIEDRPQVRLLHRPRATATMVEVRAVDRRGLIWLVCTAIGNLGHMIRSAHVSTYGAEVRDVFYIVGADGVELDAEKAEVLRAAIESGLVEGLG